MAQYRHLARAPIREAIIDFRAQCRADAAAIEASLRRSEFGYQRVGPIFNSEIGFSLNPGEGSEPTLSAQPYRMLGTRLHSTDQKYVAQFSIEGFTISRLAPYQTWEALRAEALRIWPIYQEAAGPIAITRVATRFINDLRLPMKLGDQFEDFLNALPSVPDPAFQKLSGFLTRYETIEEDAVIICTQLLQTLETGLSVILDIDTFTQRKFDVVGESAWAYLERLRNIKNRVFFNLITEKCARLYE